MVAEIVPDVMRLTLGNFIHSRIALGAMVYTDESRSYSGLPNHQSVCHVEGEGEHVRDVVSTNWIESGWSLLKRAYHGTHHSYSAEQMQR